MKNFFIALFFLAFASSSFASVAVSYVDKETSFVIGDKRAVITQGKKKYICEFGLNSTGEIDDDGLVYDAAAYKCNDRFIFVLKHYIKTDVYQVRLYNASTQKYLYDKRVMAQQFSVVSKT